MARGSCRASNNDWILKGLLGLIAERRGSRINPFTFWISQPRLKETNKYESDSDWRSALDKLYQCSRSGTVRKASGTKRESRSSGRRWESTTGSNSKDH